MDSFEPHMRELRGLIQHASGSRFFEQKFAGLTARGISRLKDFTEKIPLMELTELVTEKMSSGDPYSSRRCGRSAPPVSLQIEYNTETALYLALDQRDLRAYAKALTHCWSFLGLRKGDRVAIFDYGTSPVSYLASSAFTPYLTRGAADALGCLPICNDGVANMSQRAVEIVKFVRPRLLFLRNDCLHPFAVEVERAGLQLSKFISGLVATGNEAILTRPEQDAYQRSLGVPVYRLLRIDVAMFLGVECPWCRLLHTWPTLYFVEAVDPESHKPAGGGQRGSLVITNRFAKACPTIRYLSQVQGSLEARGCPRGARDLRIAV